MLAYDWSLTTGISDRFVGVGAGWWLVEQLHTKGNKKGQDSVLYVQQRSLTDIQKSCDTLHTVISFRVVKTLLLTNNYDTQVLSTVQPAV